ncbi:isopeptide-forming domain-containing fimbrial protein [Lysinibacillus xylanilyticus]|uniref:isopeptide-forming domain-containing fimbrial protein n=1 Tax=Lysinibacillus xylanilyticus TaxID=582475 RepID=UPI003AF2D4C6
MECEEEEESGSKENLEMACEEGYYIEEELVMEGEEQLESNIEEELEIKGEEQLESDSEEELAVKEEEQLASKCKRAISNQGIPIKDVGEIGKIDFEELGLDSPNELDGFTQMDRNSGLKMPVEDPRGRTYYMHFGDFDNTRSRDSLRQASDIDDWYRLLPTMDEKIENVISGRFIQAQNYQIATILGGMYDDRAVATYFFEKGIASKYPKGSGLKIVHGNKEDDSPRFQSQIMPLLKLYKNAEKSELIGYAAVINKTKNGDYLDGYVKIKMRPVSRKGRINVSMKYLKLSNEHAYTNFGYSVHMDIHMRHEQSKMYSLGNNKGLYFHQTAMLDNIPYILYFFRDGYENSPTTFVANNNPDTYPFGSDDAFPLLNSPGMDDDGINRGDKYPYEKHPGWALRWEPEEQKPHQIREENLEIAVTDTLEFPPEIKLDNNGEYTDEGYRITGTWEAQDSKEINLYYTIDNSKPRKVGYYKDQKSGKFDFTIDDKDAVKEGLDHDITVYVENEFQRKSNIEMIKLHPTLTIGEQVFDQDGNEPKEVAPGETLSYQILVKSGYISEDKGTYKHEEVTITQKYDTKLEKPQDLKVIDESGKKIGTATYYASKNEIEAKLDTDLPRSTKVKITFNAKVKENAEDGGVVMGQATAKGKYSTGDTFDQTSNKVEIPIVGVLKFISAPEVIDFGNNLTISPKHKTYYPIKPDIPLAVKDGRPQTGNLSWTMTAKLKTPLTVQETGATLKDSLRYRYGINDSILTTDASVEIYTNETPNREVIDISDTWSLEGDGDGLYLEVRAGTARVGTYAGTIQWELRDVPLNIE